MPSCNGGSVGDSVNVFRWYRDAAASVDQWDMNYLSGKWNRHVKCVDCEPWRWTRAVNACPSWLWNRNFVYLSKHLGIFYIFLLLSLESKICFQILTSVIDNLAQSLHITYVFYYIVHTRCILMFYRVFHFLSRNYTTAS